METLSWGRRANIALVIPSILIVSSAGEVNYRAARQIIAESQGNAQRRVNVNVRATFLLASLRDK